MIMRTTIKENTTLLHSFLSPNGIINKTSTAEKHEKLRNGKKGNEFGRHKTTDDFVI